MARAARNEIADLMKYLPKGHVGVHADDVEILERVRVSKTKRPVRNNERRYRDGEPLSERLAKALAGDVSIGDDQQGNRIYTISASPICRMFRDKRLDGTQFTALSRFHSHWWNAGLSESLRGVDLNRIYAPDPFTSAGMSRTERQYQNRKEYRSAWKILTRIEGILVTNLICSESLSLEQCGHALGYNSPFRARAAATKVVCSIADRFAKLWGIG